MLHSPCHLLVMVQVKAEVVNDVYIVNLFQSGSCAVEQDDASIS